MKHKWDWCNMCGAMVTCGKCGNNCCNGGSGRIGQLPNTMWGSTGVKCDECANAYKLQDNWESCPLRLRLATKLLRFYDFKLLPKLDNFFYKRGIDIRKYKLFKKFDFGDWPKV